MYLLSLKELEISTKNIKYDELMMIHMQKWLHKAMQNSIGNFSKCYAYACKFACKYAKYENYYLRL